MVLLLVLGFPKLKSPHFTIELAAWEFEFDFLGLFFMAYKHKIKSFGICDDSIFYRNFLQVIEAEFLAM